MEEHLKWKRNFYIITSGQTVSLIGSGAVQFALIWWLTVETGSVKMLSLAGFCASLPYAVLGPFAGAWIDRLKRKNVIIFADLLTGFVALLFAMAFFFGKPPYWTVCIVLGMRSIFGVFQTPAVQAVIPMLVPSDQIMKANSVNQFLKNGTILLSPVIGAAIYAAWPMELILLSDLAGALIACISIAAIKIPELIKTAAEKPHILNEIKEGIREYTNDKKLFSVTVVTIICFIFIMPTGALYPLIVNNIFNGTEWHISLLNVIYALGMMTGAAIIGGFSTKIKNKLKISLLGVLIFSVTSFLTGILPHSNFGFLMFLIICFIIGAGININGIPYVTYLQKNIPEEKHGRVLSLYGSILEIPMPLGLIIAGPMAERFGVMFYFSFAGILSMVIIAINGILSRHLQNFSFCKCDR